MYIAVIARSILSWLQKINQNLSHFVTFLRGCQKKLTIIRDVGVLYVFARHFSCSIYFDLSSPLNPSTHPPTRFNPTHPTICTRVCDSAALSLSASLQTPQ